jgi:glycosyltransferase involved in cell wall biosynthesis
MDRANYALAKHLAELGAETHLVAYVASDTLIRNRNIVFHRVPRPLNSDLACELLVDRMGRHWARKIAEGGGRVVVNGGNCMWPDVNWVHYVHAAYRPQTAGRLLLKLKSAAGHALFRKMERTALVRSKLIIANSNRTMHDVVDTIGISGKDIRTVYCGIDSATFYPPDARERRETRAALGWPEDRPIVAFVGGMGDRRKGFDTAFRAWTRLCADPAWDADMAVMGRGAELPLWRARLARSRVSSRIRLLGFRSDAPRILRACDALLAPTRYESYGLAVQEALCCGLPAFVSRNSGVAERYPSALQDLLIADPDDADDLISRLRAWRDDANQYAAAVASFADDLRQFSWDRMAGDIVSLMKLAA